MHWRLPALTDLALTLWEAGAPSWHVWLQAAEEHEVRMTEEDRARIQAEHVARMAEMKERIGPKAFEATQEEAAQVAEAYGLTPSPNEVVGRRKAGSEKRSRAVGRRASRPDPAPHLAPAISGAEHIVA